MVGSTIYGGITASKAAKKQKRELQAMRAENRAWYDRRYNEDATQRADAQRALTMMEEEARERNRGAAGRQAVAGGTEESVAATKEANAKGLAAATSQVAVAGEARKDAIEDSYRGRDTQLRGQLNQVEANKAANTAQAVTGVGSAVGNMFTMLDSEGMMGSRSAEGAAGTGGTTGGTTGGSSRSGYERYDAPLSDYQQDYWA